MAVTYSPTLRLANIATGTEVGQWGTLTNTNIGQLLEQAIAGQTTIALINNNTPRVLTALDGAVDESRSMGLIFTGALTVTKPITIPAVPKMYVVFNRTTGGPTTNLEIAPAGATQKAAVLQGESDIIWCDGINSYSILQRSLDAYLPLTGGTLLAPAGTSARTLTIQGGIGQTGHLTQWNNSGGTLLAYVSQSGQFHSTQGMYATGFTSSGNIDAAGTVTASDVLVNDDLSVLSDTRTSGSTYFGTGTFRAFADANYDLIMYSAGWYWSYYRPTGDLIWTQNGGTSYFHFQPNGIFSATGTINAADVNFGGVETNNAGEWLVNTVTATPNAYGVTQYAYHRPGINAGVGWNIGGVATFRLQDNGVGYAPVGWQVSSDRRVKEAIRPISDALFRLNQIVGCTFLRTDILEPKRIAGVIAQDVAAVLPEAVSHTSAAPVTDPDGALTMTVDAMGVLGLVVEAIKELARRVEEIEDQLD